MNHKTDVRPRCSKALSGPALLQLLTGNSICMGRFKICNSFAGYPIFSIDTSMTKLYLTICIFLLFCKKMVFNAKTVIGILSLLVTFMFCWFPPPLSLFKCSSCLEDDNRIWFYSLYNCCPLSFNLSRKCDKSDLYI